MCLMHRGLEGSVVVRLEESCCLHAPTCHGHPVEQKTRKGARFLVSLQRILEDSDGSRVSLFPLSMQFYFLLCRAPMQLEDRLCRRIYDIASLLQVVS